MCIRDRTNIISGQYHPIELRHQSEVHMKCVDDGEVGLYHNNNQRFVTTGIGASCVGIMSATSFHGDGSELTGIAAGGSGQFNTGLTGATA